MLINLAKLVKHIIFNYFYIIILIILINSANIYTMQERFKSNTSLLLFFLKGSIKYFVLSIIFAMIASIFELINPKIIGFTIDSVIGNKQANLPLFITNIINNHGGIELLKN